MIGLVLAAGAGRRLGGLTRDLPKTLLDVGAGRSILDRTLANLSAVGVTDVAVITGFARHRIEERVDELQQRHGVTLELVVNERAEEWNNAYSLWLARDLFAQGAMLVNGDTVHPVQVEHSVLAARGPQLLIALDQEKPLAEEEMKVLLDDQGRVRRINKALDPAAAQGEYIGVTLIEPAAAESLTDALEATWRRDPNLYYEDGFQELVDRGGEVHTCPIGTVAWVEVDSPDDLAKARTITATWA